MQDINLLQNKLKDQTNQWEKSNRTATVILTLLLLIELAIGGFFYLMTSNAEKEKADLDQRNVTLQSELNDLESDLGDAKNFQAQSKNIATLLRSHVSWSDMLGELTTSSYKSSQIFSINTDTSGKIHLEGIANDYPSVGRMLLSLETSDDFDSVRLLATANSTTETPGVMYSIDILANPLIFIRSN